jgi:hypothetical protein
MRVITLQRRKKLRRLRECHPNIFGEQLKEVKRKKITECSEFKAIARCVLLTRDDRMRCT